MEPPEGTRPAPFAVKHLDAMGLKIGPFKTDVLPYKEIDAVWVKENVVSDPFGAFSNCKMEMNTYGGDKVLVIALREEIYGTGNNFLICLTPAARERELKILVELENAKQRLLDAEAAQKAEEKKRQEELENRVYEDLPLPVRPYKSVSMDTVHLEVGALSVSNSRSRIRFQITRKRRDFGGSFNFIDADAETCVGVRQHKDPTYVLKRREHDMGLQDGPAFVSGKVSVKIQTEWFQKTNNATQYAPLALEADVREDVLAHPSLMSFLRDVGPRMEEALQQNETVDIFRDEFACIAGEEDLGLGSKGESVIYELRTFTDLAYSKSMKLSSVDWNPLRPGIVAVSCQSPQAFDERVESTGIAETYYVIIWSFQEYTPQLVLQSPHEISVVRYNPLNPSLIAGGCVSGQVIVWDTTEAMEELQQKTALKREEGAESRASAATPFVKHLHLSAVEKSHKKPVCDIAWLPGAVEFNKLRKYVESPDGKAHQFLSTSSDGLILVWDLRFERQLGRGRMASVKSVKSAAVTSETEAVQWNPYHVFPLARLDGVGTVPVARFSLGRREDGPTLYCSADSGELAFVDLAVSSEEGVSEFVKYSSPDHTRSPCSLLRSPHFPDIILSVGDYSFNIWRAGMKSPLFSSSLSSCALTCGAWSPSRPGVVFIGKKDGQIDAWDLMDQSHRASVTQPVCSCAISCIMFRTKGDTAAQQILAVGDELGNLHILDIPRTLRKPATNELGAIAAYLEREGDRVKLGRVGSTLAVAEGKVSEGKGEDEGKAEDAEEEAAAQLALEKENAALEVSYRKLEDFYRDKFGIESDKKKSKGESALAKDPAEDDSTADSSAIVVVVT